MARPEAVLLIGPTGSGKTPLGDRLERAGLWGGDCVHFDFGRRLRAAVRERPADLLSPDELDFLGRVLRRGLLLEDRHFHIARKLLSRFIEEHRSQLGRGSRLILNGLPRHLGQARDVDELVDVTAVIVLDCPPAVSVGRIRTNAGGDRDDRPDDRLDAVRQRQHDFEHRTRPVVEHYRRRGARVVELDVGVRTSAADLAAALEDRATGG
ncbi:MAG: nucleoside monophosphate kinase [Planctomycetota bacterium]